MVLEGTYRVEVYEDTDFSATWTDVAVPFMAWGYDQESIDECEEVDGVYFATYSTWVVTSPQTRTYVTETGTETITIPVGEYGIRP